MKINRLIWLINTFIIQIHKSKLNKILSCSLLNIFAIIFYFLAWKRVRRHCWWKAATTCSSWSPTETTWPSRAPLWEGESKVSTLKSEKCWQCCRQVNLTYVNFTVVFPLFMVLVGGWFEFSVGCCNLYVCCESFLREYPIKILIPLRATNIAYFKSMSCW